MAKILLTAFIGLTLTACVPDTPSGLLAPADPSRETRWSPPPSPTAGLKPFTPSDAKNWQDLNESVTPAPSSDGDKAMPGMGGMK